ncbi:MAG: hypothetical protein J3Q66DRAFT_443593 [Benniella sp.]|nr:MAG: hypothetical protein J3Q66DRAFT_443593 [Benniella sp.]
MSTSNNKQGARQLGEGSIREQPSKFNLGTAQMDDRLQCKQEPGTMRPRTTNIFNLDVIADDILLQGVNDGDQPVASPDETTLNPSVMTLTRIRLNTRVCHILQMKL